MADEVKEAHDPVGWEDTREQEKYWKFKQGITSGHITNMRSAYAFGHLQGADYGGGAKWERSQRLTYWEKFSNGFDQGFRDTPSVPIVMPTLRSLSEPDQNYDTVGEAEKAGSAAGLKHAQGVVETRKDDPEEAYRRAFQRAADAVFQAHQDNTG